MNNGIVLLTGAGLNSSIWNELTKALAAPALLIEFPNRNAGHLNKKLAFDDYVNAATEKIKSWDIEKFTIAAHSIGACVALKVAQQFQTKINGFVALGSVIPKSGGSFTSSLPFPQKILMPMILTLAGTKPPEKIIKAELCNDLTDEQTGKIVAGFTPESKALYSTRISFTLPEATRLYVKLLKDKSMPAAFQDKMAENLNAHEVAELDSGHLPMLSKPGQLGKILNDFINKVNEPNTNVH